MIYTEMSQLPKSESDRWEHAEVWPDGRRWVSRFRIDSQIAEDLEGFLKEVTDRLNEWHSGYYVAQEVALILKSVVPGLDACGLVEQMKSAVIEGELIIRKNHIPIKQADLNLDIIYGAKFREDDVNEWLTRTKAKYQLSYPYDDETFDDKSQAAPASEPVTQSATLKRFARLRFSELWSEGELLSIMCGDASRLFGSGPSASDSERDEARGAIWDGMTVESLCAADVRQVESGELMVPPETVRYFKPQQAIAWVNRNRFPKFPFPASEVMPPVSKLQPAPASESVTPAAVLLEQTGDVGLSRRETQIRAIESAAAAQGYAALSIPTGGKTLLRKQCQKSNPGLFGAGPDPFNDAWKVAISCDPPRLRMVDHRKFSGKY